MGALVILNFLHVPKELHIRNSSPSRSETKNSSSSTYFPTIFQHRIHPPENGIWLYKLCDQEKCLYICIYSQNPAFSLYHCQCLCQGLQINMYSFELAKIISSKSFLVCTVVKVHILNRI